LLVLAAIAQAVFVAAGHSPPIYDGIGFPDEPYRFVDPPSGYRTTKPPTSAHAVVALSQGRSTHGLTLNTAEQGPQLSVYLPDGALQAPAAASDVTVDAVPVAASGAPVPHHEWSNIYRVTFTASGGPVVLRPGVRATVLLRAPTFQTDPTCYVRSSGRWTALKTTQYGRDIYLAPFTGAGEYVLTGSDALNFNARDKTSEGAVGVVGFVITGVALVVIIVLFIRGERKRSRRRAQRAGSG
jgi:hypothetical protein